VGLFNRLLIGDIFDEKKASDYYAYLMASILIALILAPFFGGIFASMERWDYSFIFLGFVSGLSALTIWLFIPETLDKKRAFSLKAIWSQNKAILFQPTFYNFTIVHSVLLGAVISFFATASFYYIRKIGISPGTFSIHQVSIAFVNLGSSLLAPWFFKYFGVPKTIRISLVLITLGTIV
jgi:MFS family permease